MSLEEFNNLNSIYRNKTRLQVSMCNQYKRNIDKKSQYVVQIFYSNISMMFKLVSHTYSNFYIKKEMLIEYMGACHILKYAVPKIKNAKLKKWVVYKTTAYKRNIFNIIKKYITSDIILEILSEIQKRNILNYLLEHTPNELINEN